MTDTTLKDICRKRLSDEAWELAEKLYEIESGFERPEQLRFEHYWWRWLHQKIEHAEKLARKDPREARRHAAVERDVLDNNPTLATRLVEVEPEKKRYNAVRAARYERVEADTTASVSRRLMERLFLDAAQREEERFGCDETGQMQIGEVSA